MAPVHDNAQRSFTPIEIGPLRLRNRYIKSATNEGAAPNGVPSKVLLDHHRAMAAGGAALTTVAYCAVTADGRTLPHQIQLTREALPDLRALTDAVHAEGGAISAQITHGGAFTFQKSLSSRYPVSASGGINPAGITIWRWFKTAMGEADMAAVLQAFEDGAKLAREAGFDAVEIHMGHGYLLSQFLSPAWNKRKDAYGGSATNRARFPAQVLARVREAVGDDLAVICKLSIVEGFKGGATVEDTVEVARVLEKTGAHMLVLSAGMNVESPWVMFGSPMPPQALQEVVHNPFMRVLAGAMMRLRQPKNPFQPMYLLEHSRRIREAVSIPLAYLGGVESMDSVARAMDAGFDCVVMGRALIHDPDLVNQFQAGTTSKSGCNHCNQCVVMMYTPGGTSCVLHEPNDPESTLVPASAPNLD